MAFLKAVVASREAARPFHFAPPARKSSRPSQSGFREKLSVNQAMIEAGLRKKNLLISHHIELTAQILQANFSDEQLKILVRLIQSDES